MVLEKGWHTTKMQNDITLKMIFIFAIGALLLHKAPCDARKHLKRNHHHHHHHHFDGQQQNSLSNYAVKRANVAALPGLNIIVNSKENGLEFQIGECKVKLAIVKDCKYTLTPSPDSCGGKIPLADILNHFLPNNGLAEKSNTFILPDKFDLNSLEIDKCETTISFKASAKEKIDLVPGKFSLEGVQMGLKINYKTGAVDWELVELDIEAGVTIAGKRLPITVKKKAKETFVKFSLKIDQIQIPSIIQIFSKKEIVPEDADSEVAAKVTGLVIKTVSFSGYYDPKGFFEIVANGSPEGAVFKSSSFNVIVQKPVESDFKAAVLAKIDMFSPAALLSQLTGKDLSKIPLIKELVLNLALAVSNDDFTLIKNEELTKALGGIIKGDKTIEKGIKIYMDVPVKEVFKKLAPDLKTDNFPASLFMKVSINKDGVKFAFPDDWKSDLLQILKGLAPKMKELLPKWLQPSDGPPVIKIKEFSFDYKTMAFSVEADLDGPFKLGNILSLYNISFKISRKGEDSPFDFSFTSSQTLFEDIILTTKLSKKGEAYEFEGSISMISTGQLIRALGAKYVSEDTMKKLSFLDFGMKDVKLKAKFGNQFYISLSGTAILFGWDGVKFEGVLFDNDGTTVMALGLIIEKIRMDEIVEKLFNTKLAGITWLTELNVVLTMSNTDASAKNKDLKFENKNLQSVGIKKGVLFKAVAKIPSDCKGDQLCEMSKNATQDEKKERTLTIQGQVTPEGAELKGVYEGKWSFGTNIEVPKIEIVLKIGKETKMYFAVTVVIKDPPLQLVGTIGVGGTGALQLSASMTGIWERAFGSKYIAFGNIATNIGILPGVAVTEFAFEGELHLGRATSAASRKRTETALARRAETAADNRIKAKAAVGIDVANPMKNYFYANINKLNLAAIIEAFGLNIKLPKALMDTGFPEGLTVSFSLSEKQLKQLNIKIPPGLFLQGKINILKYELYVKCQISQKPILFDLLVEMSPIKIGDGLIALQRSKAEADKGPFLKTKIDKSGVSIKIEAFATVLGISAGTVIDISDKGFEFNISGSLFDVVSAELRVKSTFSDIKTASFHVSACIKTGADQIQKEVKSTLEESGKEATSVMGEAKKQAAGIGDLYLKSKEGITKMDDEVQDFKDKLRKKGKDISEAKKALNEKCIEECSTECIGGPDWDPKCLELDGEFIGCPIWNDCKFKVPNYDCLAKCKGKSAFGQLRGKAKQAGLEVLLKLLEGIKALFNLGKSFFDKSRKLLNTAKEVFSEAKEKLKAGLDAAKAAATTAIENLVQIHSMCFESGLSEAAKACVGFKISATFFKTKKVDFDTKGCLDVSFAKQIAQAIADKMYPGIKSLKEAIGGLKAKFGLISKEKDNVEETADKAKKVCKDDGKKCKKDIIWTEEENYYWKLAYEQLPRFTLRDEETMRAFEKDTSSQRAAADNPMAKANIENPNRFTITAKKRQSVTDAKDPCQQITRRLETAANVTDGMKALVESYKKQKKKFKEVIQSKKNRINQLAVALRAECLYYGCNAASLDDALFYVRKARKEISEWGRTVDSQIKRQDIESFRAWKKDVNLLMKATKGEGLSNYLKGLVQAREKLESRTGIAKSDQTIDSLKQISKKFAQLMDNDVSLIKSVPAIDELASDIAKVKSSNTVCSP